MWNSTDVGSIAAFIANSLIMCLPWWGYRVCKRNFGARLGYAALILFWMGFEYIHLNWQLSWPWLTLGNVFASHPDWVQWYEYTGTSGGTLWVLLMNVLIYDIIKKYDVGSTRYEVKNTKLEVRGAKYELRKLFPAISVLVIPFILSFVVKPTGAPATPAANVLIIQPNIDPYGKNDPNSVGEQVQTLLSLTSNNIDSSTRLVVWPETAMSAESQFEDRVFGFNPVQPSTKPLWQQQETPTAAKIQVQQREVGFPAYKPIWQFVQTHPNISLVSGIETFINYGMQAKTPTARQFGDGSGYYDAFNAAIALKAGDTLTFYHKSRLVPGVETLPNFLRFMAPVFEKFGGTTGGYGRQDEASIMQQPNQPYIVAPIICYESIYGEYVSTYVKKGANLLTIMTNDGWWGNTPGHKQHLQYARLRAIETRRWVARSANTGISAVIDEKGNILATQPWAKAAFIKYNIPMLTGETFYVKYGDVLSKVAVVLGGLLLAWHWVTLLRKRFS